MSDPVETIAALLEQTKEAHFTAYIETDGADPDWPIWYAAYLVDKLPPLLQANMTKSEITYLLVHLSRLQQLDAPGSQWTRYYAKAMVEKLF